MNALALAKRHFLLGQVLCYSPTIFRFMNSFVRFWTNFLVFARYAVENSETVFFVVVGCLVDISGFADNFDETSR